MSELCQQCIEGLIMKILILEDDTARLMYFNEKFYRHELTMIENANSAIEYLENKTFDCIFLDHDLGYNNGFGADVASYLGEHPDNPNNQATIIIHSWNTPGAQAMLAKLKNAYIAPFGSDAFISIKG